MTDEPNNKQLYFMLALGIVGAIIAFMLYRSRAEPFGIFLGIIAGCAIFYALAHWIFKTWDFLGQR